MITLERCDHRTLKENKLWCNYSGTNRGHGGVVTDFHCYHCMVPKQGKVTAAEPYPQYQPLRCKEAVARCLHLGDTLTLEEGREHELELLNRRIKMGTCGGKRHEQHCKVHKFTNLHYCMNVCDQWDDGKSLNYITSASPVADILPFFDAHPDLFDQPTRSLHNFERWPNIQKAFRQAWPVWRDSVPPAPNFARLQYAPRGVVMIGGGERYEIGLYVACRMLRHFGWCEPIMLWHRGEWEPVNRKLFTPLDVTVIDAVAYRNQSERTACRRWGMDRWTSPDNRWGGWGLKSYAVLHSPFTQVFYQDADWYLAADASRLRACFDVAATGGSLIWYDTNNGNDSTVKWGVHGLPSDAMGKGFQGGQWLIDKGHLKVWQALNLYRKLDDYSDYYYRHHYGDQDSFRLAWAMCDAPRTSFRGRCWLRNGGMVARDGSGEFLGVHRINDKQFRAELRQMPVEGLALRFAAEYHSKLSAMSASSLNPAPT